MNNFLISILICTLTAGTTSCSSAKVLTESLARELVRNEIKRTNAHFVVSVSALAPAMQRSQKDYTTTTTTSGPEHILKGLIAKKLVTQQCDIVSYPKIAGIFKATNQWGAWWEFNLSTEPDSNVVTGTVRHQGTNYARPSEKTIRWIVQPNGVIDLGGGDRYRYDELGAEAHLIDISVLNSGQHYIGPASGQKTQVKWYTYAFTEAMKKQISERQHGPLRQTGVFGELRGSLVPAGDFVLGEVTNLQLVLDTHAAANLSWTVTTNDLGEVLLGSEKLTGKTEVHFVKKPDGTWVLDSKEE